MNDLTSFLKDVLLTDGEYLARLSKGCERVNQERAREHEEERTRYLRDSFAGKCEDWAQFVEDPRALLVRIKELARSGDYGDEDHGDALRQIQLLLSVEIVKAAEGHVEQCVKNNSL